MAIWFMDIDHLGQLFSLEEQLAIIMRETLRLYISASVYLKLVCPNREYKLNE